VEAGVDDAVHVQVQVVVDANAIGPCGGFRQRRRCAGATFVFLGGDDDIWVLTHEPFVHGWHPHGMQGGKATSQQLQPADLQAI